MLIGSKMEADDEMDGEFMNDTDTETETSIGSIDREEQQDMIEHYTTLMLQKIVSDPYVSVPEIMDMLKQEEQYERNRQSFKYLEEEKR